MPEFSDQKSVLHFSFFSSFRLSSLFHLHNITTKNLCTAIVFSTDTHRFTGDKVYGFPGWHLGEYRGGGLVASSAIPVTSIGLDYFPGYRF